MAWRPEQLVLAGELDNTLLGWTVGLLELEGIDELPGRYPKSRRAYS